MLSKTFIYFIHKIQTRADLHAMQNSRVILSTVFQHIQKIEIVQTIYWEGMLEIFRM